MKMREYIFIAVLISAGCASTPDWWLAPPTLDREALDFYLWQKYTYGRQSCATYYLCSHYPPKTAGPVIENVYAMENNDTNRLDTIEMLAEMCFTRGYGIDKSIIRTVEKAALDQNAEVRKAGLNFMKELEKKGAAEQSAAPLPRAPQTGHSKGAH